MAIFGFGQKEGKPARHAGPFRRRSAGRDGKDGDDRMTPAEAYNAVYDFTEWKHELCPFGSHPEACQHCICFAGVGDDGWTYSCRLYHPHAYLLIEKLKVLHDIKMEGKQNGYPPPHDE